MKLSKGLLMTALITGCVYGGVTPVFAEESVAEFTLDPMIVTAQRTETKDLETPASVVVVDSIKIEAAGYKNAFDVIDHQLGLSSTGYGDAGQDFGFSSGRTVIRGYDRGTLVMVDGIPINLKNYNSLDGIPVEMIEKVEIIKGAAGTLYGAEAMGGVVNIITKKAGNEKPSFKVKGTYGNYYKNYGMTYSGSGILLNVQKEYSDKINKSNDYPKGSSTDWWIGKGQKNRASVAAKITDEISFNFMYEEDKITRGSYTKNYKIKSNPNVYDFYNYSFEGKRLTTGIHYSGLENGISATVGYNYRVVDGFDYAKNSVVDSSAHLNSYIADIQKKWDIGKSSIISGYTFKREGYKNSKTVANKAHRENNAVYISYNHVFSEKFNTTLGVRGELISDPVKNQNIANPQIQTLYKFDDTTSWYTNVGRAFQMPTVDAYYGKKAASDSLKPEKGWTYETGVKKLLSEDSSLKLSVYHMKYSNKLGWGDKDPLTDLQPAINKGNFKNTGFEIAYDQKLSKAWNYSLGIGFSNPCIKDPSVAKPVWTQDSARIDGTALITYAMENVRSALSFKYLGNRESYSTFGQVPYKARLSWNTSVDLSKHDTITLTLNNLLGRDNYANRYANLELPYNWRVMYTHTF